MSNPAEFALRRPRAVAVCTLLLVIYGLLSYALLPRQENPPFQDNNAYISVQLPGASPEKSNGW